VIELEIEQCLSVGEVKSFDAKLITGAKTIKSCLEFSGLFAVVLWILKFFYRN
jgi:hypothetical protein